MYKYDTEKNFCLPTMGKGCSFKSETTLADC